MKLDASGRPGQLVAELKDLKQLIREYKARFKVISKEAIHSFSLRGKSKLRKAFMGGKLDFNGFTIEYCPLLERKPVYVTNISKSNIYYHNLPRFGIIKPGSAQRLSDRARIMLPGFKSKPLEPLIKSIRKSVVDYGYFFNLSDFSDIDYSNVDSLENLDQCQEAYKILRRDFPQVIVTGKWWDPKEDNVGFDYKKPYMIHIPGNLKSFLELLDRRNQHLAKARIKLIKEGLLKHEGSEAFSTKLHENTMKKLRIIYDLAHEYGHAHDHINQGTEFSKLSIKEKRQHQSNKSCSTTDLRHCLLEEGWDKDELYLITDSHYINGYKEEKYAHDFAIDFIRKNQEVLFPELFKSS